MQWTITYQQKAGNVLVFGLMTSTLSLVVGAPVALALTALYWAAGLGGLENLPVIMPTALGVSLPFSAWICRSRLWWTVRFEDYTLRLGNSFSGKVFPCERIILVRAGSNTGLAVAPGGINMEGMVPVEVVSERHGRCTVHMTLYQATDLLHFLHWQCPQAVIMHSNGQHVLPFEGRPRRIARRRLVRVNLTSALLQATVALVLGAGCLTSLVTSQWPLDPSVLVTVCGALIGVGYVGSGAVYSARRALRCLRKAQAEQAASEG